MARVTTIPATISRFTATPINEKKKRRTAAYARVSTDSEEQLTSYTAQVDYYTNYIKGRDDWEFVSVYTDEGITGTNTKHREGFKRMVQDALDGKIDLIVTKSVSRFARNTVDSLTTVRQLKEKGVDLDIGFQGRIADYHHVEPCPGRKSEHFRELHLGAEKAFCRWQGDCSVPAFPWL